MRKIKTIITVICLAGLFTSCSIVKTEPTFKKYSEIRDIAYTDKSEIDPAVTGNHGVFQKTVAGVVKALDERDAKALKKLCCNFLLDMEETDELIDEMLDGFEGDVIDTSPIDGDFKARETALFSEDEPSAYYGDTVYIYTDKQIYYMLIDMYSVHENVPDGEDFIGVTSIRLLTLDKFYGLKRLADPIEGENNGYIDHYTFADGNEMDVTMLRGCFIASAYGDSSDYIVGGFEKNNSQFVFELTGSEDEISMKDLKKIDFTDKDELEEKLFSLEPYAKTDDGTGALIFALEDSDEYIYTYKLSDGGVWGVWLMDEDYIIHRDVEPIYEDKNGN